VLSYEVELVTRDSQFQLTPALLRLIQINKTTSKKMAGRTAKTTRKRLAEEEKRVWGFAEGRGMEVMHGSVRLFLIVD
jgi:hypothetical protein